ncbi:Chymotrypsin-like protease CTRL-1 [Mizuhopecten yessoensis]|uniref:Chymotrypsin-like protease CTRL-1 n=1 Tax=Mizuhopecten yessoensis TaxID=6573 RepID=A0A210PLG7_MIZYE|nr:Chymotrypsin-like protease CTRL-1 [Mizuhopecten yessoensis]
MTGWLLIVVIVINGIGVCIGNGQRLSKDEEIDGNHDLVGIIGGVNATDDAWPWQVSVKYMRRFTCGGTLLNENTVLTAAHCIIKRRARRFLVNVGDYDRRVPEQGRNELSVKVKRVHVHPDYNRRTLVNDVAILKLKEPVAFGTHIQPIELATSAMDVSLNTCYITGWGLRDNKVPKTAASILQQAAVSVISNDECQKGLSNQVTDDMICTEDPSRATCYGDSGGPLQCEIEAGRWVQVGITSWGNKECLDGPSVYSRVSYNRAWIIKKM